MASSASLSVVIDAPVDRIHAILLAAPQLPEWNPAFVRVAGPARASTDTDYELEIIRGLRGTLRYPHIDRSTVVMTWAVPLLAETGTWLLATDAAPSRTRVTHTVERRGPLAALIGHSLDSLPTLRLERLAQRTAASNPARGRARTPWTRQPPARSED